MMMRAMTLPAKPSDPPPDAEDVRLCLAGDELAFERLVDRYQRQVLNLCQRLAGAREAKDLFQETFLHAFRALPQLRSPGAFRTWLFRIAVRCSRRRLGARSAASELADPDSLAAPSSMRPTDPLELDEDVARLRHLLALLPARQREVVVLRHFDELSFAEIGAILGISEEAARANHYQGVKRLRTEYDA